MVLSSQGVGAMNVFGLPSGSQHGEGGRQSQCWALKPEEVRKKHPNLRLPWPSALQWVTATDGRGVGQNEAIHVCSLPGQRGEQQSRDPGGNGKEPGKRKGVTASTPTPQSWNTLKNT